MVRSDESNRRRAAGSAALASAVEWYDYFIFGVAAALVLGKQFFPSHSPVAGVLAAFATFFVGFAARPIGGAIAGQLGDKYGRKPVLAGALALMGVATTLMGLLPSFDTIGVAAPILLVLLRVVQGLAVGAQWGGAVLMATEYAPEHRKGLYGSFVQLGVPIGVILANSVFLIAAWISGSGFASWGWRLPFVIGVFVLILAWFIHTKIEETPEFRAAERKLAATEGAKTKSPLGQILRKDLGTVLLAAGSFAVNTAVFYMIITGVLDYATRELHMNRDAILAVSICVSLTQLAVLPLAARWSDRVGRLKVYTIGCVGIGVWAVPMFLLIDTANYGLLALGTLVCSFFLSIMYGPQAALFAELFPPRTRYTGASLGYQFAGVVGGGLAPFVMVALLEGTNSVISVGLYVIVLTLIALGSIAVLAKRAKARQAFEATTDAAPAV
jgi:MFS family permease